MSWIPKVVKEVMILHRSSGLYLLALPNGRLLQEPITGEQISRVLDYMRSFYDYLVINTSNYINEATLASLDLADVIVLVITQEIASIKSMRILP